MDSFPKYAQIFEIGEIQLNKYLQNPIFPGSHVAREGKTMIVIRPVRSRVKKGKEPPTMSFMVIPGTEPFRMNRLRPTGGVIMPISTLIVTTIPNQTGSKPSCVTMGKMMGREMTRAGFLEVLPIRVCQESFLPRMMSLNTADPSSLSRAHRRCGPYCVRRVRR